MSCALLGWVANRIDLSLHLQGTLLRLVRLMDARGQINMPQSEIAAAIGLGERQTRTNIKDLVLAGAIIRRRQGSIGKGRSADILVANIVDIGDMLPIRALPHDNGDNGSTYNCPPTPPYKNIPPTPKGELNPETPEPSLGGVGGLFADEAATATKPKRQRVGTKRRPKREKFYATEAAMPTALSEPMAAFADKARMINGTREREFEKFRRYHIREGSLIASVEQRWETWVDNWADRNPQRPDGAPPGYKLVGYGEDGKARYLKDQRQNFYK